MTGEELRGGVHDEVGTVVAGAHEIRRADGVVDDERDAGPVGDLGDRLEVEHLRDRVRDRFGEQCARGRTDRSPPGIRVVLVDERHLDPEVGEGVLKQVDRAAVQLVRRHDVPAAADECQQCHGHGRLARCDGDG